MVENIPSINYNVFVYGNEVYDNYFKNLKRWILEAKEYEETYVNLQLAAATNLQNNVRNEVNNNDGKL